jgi:hypothetical protein
MVMDPTAKADGDGDRPTGADHGGGQRQADGSVVRVRDGDGLHCGLRLLQPERPLLQHQSHGIHDSQGDDSHHDVPGMRRDVGPVRGGDRHEQRHRDGEIHDQLVDRGDVPVVDVSAQAGAEPEGEGEEDGEQGRRDLVHHAKTIDFCSNRYR